MIYIHVESHQLKILALKKSLLGQYEITTFEKKHEMELLSNGKVENVDVLASAVKEALTHVNALNDKEVCLILPQESFAFMKVEVPSDITSSAIAGFVYDKARATLQIDVDSSYSSFFVKDTDKQKQVSFYAVEATAMNTFAESLNLLGLKIVNLVPETLAIFKLFEKTLRQEKKENIWYVSYNGSDLSGYLYDSGGLASDEHWTAKLSEGQTIEEVLKEKTDAYAASGNKLNRIILSGNASDSVRQDTFTKAVGAWTNPLKRIIPNFYDEYLKSLVVPTGTVFPILVFDVCFGAFIFSQENKDFQMLKKAPKISGKGGGKSFSMPSIPLFKKEILIFLLAFGLSFGAFLALSRLGSSQFKMPALSNPFAKVSPTPTPQPTPTPTPAPSYNKEELRIKVLNGSGASGIASTARDLLTDAGFTEIVTDNADNYDYETTVYQIKDEFKDAESEITKALDGAVKNPEVETLDEDDTSDVIIILGADFK